MFGWRQHKTLGNTVSTKLSGSAEGLLLGVGGTAKKAALWDIQAVVPDIHPCDLYNPANSKTPETFLVQKKAIRNV